jgi:cation-transporting ATPase 13A3/4/5
MAMTQILNPMLPAVFVVGQSVAAERMARRDIYCTGFDRITMAGV